MNKFNTKGIILARVDYSEADRIITLLTPDHGKIKVLAKAVRKSKSKLAGGLELFSISEIGVLVGRGEINTLVSSRLVVHFSNIVKSIERTTLAYGLIKQLDKATEDQTEEGYFDLLKTAFEALADETVDLKLIEVWFDSQLLKLAGHAPNLHAEKSGVKLAAGQRYDFNHDTMSFQPGSKFGTDQIKFLRLLFSANPPKTLQKVQNAAPLAQQLNGLIRSVLQNYIRI